MTTELEEALDSNYARAGYHTQQVWGRRPALILIDFAQAYFDPAARLFGGDCCRMALNSALRLREIARAGDSGNPHRGAISRGRRGRRHIFPQSAAALLLYRGRGDAGVCKGPSTLR